MNKMAWPKKPNKKKSRWDPLGKINGLMREDDNGRLDPTERHDSRIFFPGHHQGRNPDLHSPPPEKLYPQLRQTPNLHPPSRPQCSLPFSSFYPSPLFPFPLYLQSWSFFIGWLVHRKALLQILPQRISPILHSRTSSASRRGCRQRAQGVFARGHRGRAFSSISDKVYCCQGLGAGEEGCWDRWFARIV